MNADTGEYVWHYQTVPGDNWDYTSTMTMTLADLVIDGQPRKVLMQAPKNGFFYVIDRLTGRLISAEKITEHVTWATHVDMKTGPSRGVDDRALRHDWRLDLSGAGRGAQLASDGVQPAHRSRLHPGAEQPVVLSPRLRVRAAARADQHRPGPRVQAACRRRRRRSLPAFWSPAIR